MELPLRHSKVGALALVNDIFPPTSGHARVFYTMSDIIGLINSAGLVGQAFADYAQNLAVEICLRQFPVLARRLTWGAIGS